ncbi:aldose 1-epimerase family protein [Spelaeicoccus albus]|uniref:Aldose 1-epimerase n=1 Tax=Spelaeicoccus albus TaxID=1280376 RepID=A0A7Z0D3D5_9MICO|nr:aldose 1-epimerase family protein [Spelaeicoccus albus]NYI68143.1 aldose 1-epimerase [Spelaeicoccus albus]
MNLSGNPVHISHGDYSARIAPVGASLSSLNYGGRDLVVPYDTAGLRPSHRGAVLAPWPNRIIDGTYAWQGRTYQLPLTEPARHNAIHGLVDWNDFELTGRTDASATLSTPVVPVPGYPHCLRVTVTYALDDDGLSWTVETENLGDDDAPYGVAVHPYFTAGPGRADDWTLTFPGTEYIESADEQMRPGETKSVRGSDVDFTAGRPLRGISCDLPFTKLQRSGGRAEARLLAADGTGVAISCGDDTPWMQVFTADSPDPDKNRIGVALEPMTCPPDAFNSGTDVVRIAPGDLHRIEWHIAAVRNG